MQQKDSALDSAVGALLKSARQRRRMTLDEVARSLGYSKSAVGHWETGRNTTSASDLLKLAKIYDVPVSDLVPDVSEVSIEESNQDFSGEQRWGGVGQRIASLRKEAAQTRVALARAVGVSTPAIAYWEDGSSKNLKHENLDRVAKHFGVSMQWLVTGVGPRQPAEALVPAEQEVLQLFRRLGSAEKDALLSYLNWLASKAASPSE